MTGPVAALLALMGALLMSSLWIGFALMGTGVFTLQWFRDMPVDRMLARDVWGSITGDELVTLPLFILMGDILYHTKLSESLFRGLSPWVVRLPGRLLHVNVIGCTLFAAVCGSSAATTATVGRMTLQELLKRGYDRNLAMGSLAGAGTIGLLIPPSIAMVVYGVLAETSILDLFIAGIVPGLIVAALYMAWIAFRAITDPSVAPAEDGVPTWGDRLRALMDLGPVLFLIAAVIGSMYSGVASVTEAAAVGVVGALIVAAGQRTLSWPNLKSALLGTVRTCSMIGLILCGALFLAKAMTLLGVPAAVADWVRSLGLSPYMLILVLLVVYLILGTALDGLSAMVMTLPIAIPLVTAAGFDKVWFGIFMVLVIEMAQITPPVAFNLSVIQSISGQSMSYLTRVTMPYLLIMMLFVILLAVFPQIVLWLPEQVLGR
jgi:tripartite ATP-independent transporter DctM subunit